MENEHLIFACFPGQGSQKVGMGKDLKDSSELARELFYKADKALGFELSKICFEGPQDRLTNTDIAQPAILLTSVISYKLIESRVKSQIVCAAGHSLGEYSALVASNSISLEDAVLLVHKRGCYMQEAVPAGEGKMVAILGKEVSEIQDAINKVSKGVAAIANINAPGQVVIAGNINGVDEAINNLSAAKVISLQVSAPFHCSLMKPAEISLSKDLDALSIKEPEYPIIANVTAQATTSVEQIRALLKEQVCAPVRWVESVQYGIEKYMPNTLMEFGAGNVLTGLSKRIAPTLNRINVYSGTEF